MGMYYLQGTIQIEIDTAVIGVGDSAWDVQQWVDQHLSPLLIKRGQKTEMVRCLDCTVHAGLASPVDPNVADHYVY